MTNSSTFILLPFIAAFLTFALRFYSREGAGSMTRPSFLMAVVTALTAAAYLALGVTGNLPPYGTITFAGIGLLLLGFATMRMFML